MKKKSCLMICLALIFSLAAGVCGCGAEGKGQYKPAAGVNEVLEQGMAEADGKAAEEAAQAEGSVSAEESAPAEDPVSPEESAAAEDPAQPAESASEEEPAQPEESVPVEEPAQPEESAPAEPAPNQEGPSDGIDVDLTVLSSTMVYSEVYNMMLTPDQYIGKTVKMEGLFASYHAETTGNTYFACIIRDATACCSQGIEFILTDDYTYPDDYPEVNEEICVCGVFDKYQEGRYTYYTLRDAKLL